MRRSRIEWAFGVIAPWCLAMGVLVAISADAGQSATLGGSFAQITSRALGQPDDLIPTRGLALTGDIGGFGLHDDSLILPVKLDVGGPDDLVTTGDEIEPRTTLKPRVGPLPVIDRAHKSDPTIGLRPSFDTRLRQPNGLVLLRQSQMIGPRDEAMPAASFSLQDTSGPLDGATSFSPWGEGEDPQDADEAPTPGGWIAMQPSALKQRLLEGATPPVSRAEALSSTTPAPADGPVVATLTPAHPLPDGDLDASTVSRTPGRPDYAALLVGDRGARERKCLAEAVYFEARSEPEAGQAAVAQVVLNRATSGLYPASICGVVYQGRSHYKACQFSFACEGKSLRITEADSWRTATRIADEIVRGKTYLSDLGGATHYHANYVRPGWARRLVKMDVIGHHIFYKLRSQS